jgi:hypothetical protein
MSAADQVDFKEMAAKQNHFPETQCLLGGTSLKLAFRQTGAQCLAGDVSTGNFHPIVPLKFRKSIFDQLLNVAHPREAPSRRINSSRFVWRSLSSNVTGWARGCLACQRGKMHRCTHLVPQPIPIPQWRFSHLYVDLVGPFQQYSNNFNYIFTIIDRTSKWMEAIPLSEMSAVACTKALTFTWISISRFRVPETITSDRGPQFTSNLWVQLCQMLNILHKQTTAYHPESTGTVERLQSRLKDAIRARAAAATWSEELPFVLLGLRAQPREDTGLSPAEAVFGAQIVLPNEFLQNYELSVDTIVKKFSKTLHVSAPSLPRHNSSAHLPSELPAELLSVPLVWVHQGGMVPPFRSLYDGPYAVLRHGPHYFTIRVGSRDEAVAVRRLKACTAMDATPGSPRCRGRPPGSTQAVLSQPSGSRSQTRWSLRLLFWRRNETSRNSFPTWRGGFCMPGVSGAITGATAAVPIPSTGTAIEVGPLTSSPPSRDQSSGGALWTPAYTPGDGQTSWVYILQQPCTALVYKPLFNCQYTSAVVPLVALTSTSCYFCMDAITSKGNYFPTA